jgi:ABC-2 type transport system ATP-binding protein
MTPALRARTLSLRHGAAAVLEGIDLELAPNECVGLTGPRPRDTSALMRVLATLLRPSSGILEIDGFDTSGRLAEARSRLAYVGLPLAPAPRLRLREYMQFCLEARRGSSSSPATVDQALRFVAMPAETPVDALSPVMQWAVSLGLAVACGPRVALVDHPPGTDDAVRRACASAVQELALQGAAVLVAMDDPGAQPVCQRMVSLQHGSLRQVRSGEPAAPLALIGQA